MDDNKTNNYTVRAGTFEGPLDLLLSLIEQRKLFVNEISLASVTDDYISYVKSLSDDKKNINDVSYFILISATLILIKSKSLLPNLALTEDETEKIVDLEKRLKIYQIIKNASIDIKDNFGVKIIFQPLERVWNDPIFAPDGSMTVSLITSCIRDILNQVPKQEKKLEEIEVKRVINIEEFIDGLTSRIQDAMNLSFREFTKSHGAANEEEARVHVIVSFLAMLELVREGIIDVVQNSSFGDIEMNKQTSPIPDIGVNS